MRLASWANPKTLLIIFGVVTVLQIAVLSMRIESIWIQRETIGTTGLEGAIIYPIWKVIHGYPLYEWPYRFPFTSTPYNFLFFETYGQLFRFLRLDGPDVLIYGKFLTLTFALAGAIVQYWLCQVLAPSLKSIYARASFALSALLTWFGTGFTSWWALTVRPDVGATMFALLGLVFGILAIDRNQPSKMVLASVLMFLGWAFKQTTIVYAVGLGIYLICRGRWKDVLRLSLPFSVLCAATFIVGDEVYFYNTIKFDLDLGTIAPPEVMRLILTGLRPNAFFWSIGILGLVLFRVFSSNSKSETATLLARANQAIRHQPLIILNILAGLVLALAAYTLPGSSRNHLFQAHAIVGVLSSLIIATVCTKSPVEIIRSMRAAIIVALILAGALPALQLIHPNRYGLQNRFEPTVFDARRKFAEYLRTLEKPIYVDDDIFSLPWFVTDNRYPAFLVDELYYDTAVRNGLIENGGMEALITRRCFAIVLVPASDPWVAVATAAEYRKEPFDPLWSTALEAKKPWVKLTRTQPRDPSCGF